MSRGGAQPKPTPPTRPLELVPRRGVRGPKAPAYLEPVTRRWYAGIVRTYELEPHHFKLLEGAGAAWDQYEAARAIVAREGLTYLDRFKCPRARPEVAIMRDARILYARLLRELALDVTAPGDARPPGLGAGLRRS
jgi:phage terminase small subunit